MAPTEQTPLHMKLIDTEAIRNCLEHDPVDLYTRVKLRHLHYNVSGGFNGKMVEENVKNSSGGLIKFIVSHKCDSVADDNEIIDQITVIQTSNLALSKEDNAADAKDAKLMVDIGYRRRKFGFFLAYRQRYGSGRVDFTNFGLLDLRLDEGTAAQMLGALKGARMRKSKSTFEFGDIVWAKFRSHPWWPGEIFDERLASAEVSEIKKEGHVLVSFFGDNTYQWFDPTKLFSFDSHFAKNSKQTNDQAFLAALQQATDEVKKRAAVGLVCNCHGQENFRPNNIQGFYEVDVDGYGQGVFSLEQIERARDDFVPSKAIFFLKQLALSPFNAMQSTVEWMKNVAKLLAYRTAVFEDFDETYPQAFGVEPKPPVYSKVVLDDQQKGLGQAPVRSQSMITQSSKDLSDHVKVKNLQKRYQIHSTQREESDGSKFHSGGQLLTKKSLLMSEKKPEPEERQNNSSVLEVMVMKVDSEGSCLVPSVEAELVQQSGSATTAGIEAIGSKNLHDIPSVLKSVKICPRGEVLAKAGKRHCISACQEQGSNIQSNKKSNMDVPDSENKIGYEIYHKVQKGKDKRTGATISAKPTEDPLRKPPSQTKNAEPTGLILRFPPQTTLPSKPELKAKFARFRSLDKSSIRLFWKSTTCRVGFKCKSEAEAAYSYAMQNTRLFGSTRVKYHLQAYTLLPKSVGSGKSVRIKTFGDMGQQSQLGATKINFSRSGKCPCSPVQDIYDGTRICHFVDEIYLNYRQAQGSKDTNTQNITANTSANISTQMLDLLTKCSNIVSNLKSSSNYMPRRAL